MNRPSTITFDDKALTGNANEPLIDFLKAHGINLPSVCYNPSLGPIETCDTCWVTVNGEMQRGCTLRTEEGLNVSSQDKGSRSS